MSNAPSTQFLANLPPTPRRVRPAKLYRVLTATLVGLGVFIVGLSAVLAYFDLKELTMLRAEGRKTTGFVNGKFVIHQRGGEEYRLEYEFLANNKRYSGHDPVPQAQWEASRKGDSVPVLYAPSDPEMHLLGTGVSDTKLQSRQRFWPAMIGGTVLLFALLLLPMRLEVRKHSSLLRDGVAVDAEVVSVDQVPGTALYTLRYRFPDSSGAPVEGKAKVGEFSARMLSQLGGVTVLVNPQDPTQHRPYFLTQGAELV